MVNSLFLNSTHENTVKEEIIVNTPSTSVWTYKGNTYRTMKEMCEDLNISRTNVKNHLYSLKMTLESSIDRAIELRERKKERSLKPKKVSSNPRSFTHEGVLYSNIRDFCIKNGYDYPLIISRLRDGHILDEAISMKRQVKMFKGPVMYKGVEYSGIKNMAKSLGVTYEAVHEKLKKGIKLELAVDEAIKDKNKKGTYLLFRGVSYRNLHHLCKENKFSRTSLQKMLDSGLTIEEALVEYLGPPVEFNGVNYVNLKDICDAYGVPFGPVRGKMSQKNISAERAFTDALDLATRKGSL
jgi:predicted DNA-binding protein YlxM (UPF0122 family)